MFLAAYPPKSSFTSCPSQNLYSGTSMSIKQWIILTAVKVEGASGTEFGRYTDPCCQVGGLSRLGL